MESGALSPASASMAIKYDSAVTIKRNESVVPVDFLRKDLSPFAMTFVDAPRACP